MKKSTLVSLLLSILFIARSYGQVNLEFDFGNRGPEISSDHYGIFFEELSHAGDGGLYAELIQNRSFEDNANSAVHWSAVGGASISLTEASLMNSVQKHALLVKVSSANGGIRNDGYWGINIVKSDTYELSFWIRSAENWTGEVIGRLVSSGGSRYGESSVIVEAGEEWKQYKMSITATNSDGKGFFDLRFSSACEVSLDMVSLFPPTFNDRANGFRRDLAEKLSAIRPSFMRFPGGCYSEGTYDRGSDCRYIWKHSVGPQEERIPLWNSKWGYTVTQGQGIYEYLQFCEDIGAVPMYVVNVGLGHGWWHDKNDLDEYIDEALDVIEYCNGGTDTYWGSKRAEAGHPEPFNLKYIEVGNENANYHFNNNNDQSLEYFDRYIQFYTAIKSRYPDIAIIGNVQAWGTDAPSWRSNHPVDILDEHYYRNPSWFIDHYTHYDNYSRSNPQVYVGEYSANSENGKYGTMLGAAAEAVFMEGMENNSDVVRMTSFSEPFAHDNDIRWHSMIYYDSSRSFGSPSYYVQKMFSTNVGRQNIRWKEEGNLNSLDENRSIGLGTWSTSSVYSDLQVVDSDGNSLYDFTSAKSSDWVNEAGQWSIADGVFTQSLTSGTRSTYTLVNGINTGSMTYTLKGKKLSGSEGFLVIFDFKDVNNYAWWAIGGWSNTQHGVEQNINGTKRTLASVAGKVEVGREYDIKIEKVGLHVKCYLDGQLIHEFDLQSPQGRKVYVAASVTDESGDSYIKLVNPSGSSHPVHLSFANGKVVSASAEVLSSSDGSGENTLSHVEAIVPRESPVSIKSDGSIDFDAVPFSVNILKLKVEDINIVEEPLPELPSAFVEYSFEGGIPSDDSGEYAGKLFGKSEIVEIGSSGNHALYTGAVNGKGYMDMGTKVFTDALGHSDEFSISVNVNHNSQNNLNQYCWVYAFSSGTSKYVALVNAPGNGDWYYEVKNGSTQNTHSRSGLTIGRWHNISYVQKDGVGTIYVDGQKLGTSDISILPRDISGSVSTAHIGRSPFASDAYMEGMYVDDFRIYDKALDAREVKSLASEIAGKEEPDDSGYLSSLKLAKLLNTVRPLMGGTVSPTLDESYANATSAYSGGTSKLMESAYALLDKAFADYKSEQMSKAYEGLEADLTFLIKNSSFVLGSSGWQGTGFTAITDETAEQWNKTFDVYQEIADAPAGRYRFSASAFYRAGGVQAGYNNYTNHSSSCENAQLYINDASVSVVNFFADTKHFTYNPYTYPNNLSSASSAVNGETLYKDNSVEYVLPEAGSLQVGIRKLAALSEDWAVFDNFRLVYLGSDGTGMTSIGSDIHVVSEEIYTLSGQRIQSVQPGVNIIRRTMSDKSVRSVKVLIQ